MYNMKRIALSLLSLKKMVVRYRKKLRRRFVRKKKKK